MTLLDAAGLAAIIGAAPSQEALRGVLPLGAASSARYLAPGRGRLTATCLLPDDARKALAKFYTDGESRLRLTTETEIVDATGTPVCQGAFDWSLRRAS